jgi:hypothetical protein
LNASGVVFQCASCRALTVAGAVFVDDAKRAGLQCTSCGAMSYLPIAGADDARGPTVVVDADAAARATPPSRALPASTSTIVAASTSATTSSRAWSGDVHERIVARVAKIGDAASPELVGLAGDFDRLLGRWDDAAEHSKFLKKAASIDQLAFAGQRYRAVLEIAPGDAAARKAQGDLMTMAMATFSAQKDLGAITPERSKTVQLALAMAVIVVTVIAAIWFLPRLLPPADGGATMSGPADGPK